MCGLLQEHKKGDETFYKTLMKAAELHIRFGTFEGMDPRVFQRALLMTSFWILISIN